MQTIKRIGTLLGVLALLFTGFYKAQAGQSSARTVVELVPDIPEAMSNKEPAQTFFTRTVVLRVPEGHARLASTADGQGQLCTDDQATITFQSRDGRMVRWAHSYASPDRQRIVCLPPQVISLPLGAGPYTVTVTLEDTYAPKYGSHPYVLVFDTLQPERMPAATIQPAAHSIVTSAQPSPMAMPTQPVATLTMQASPYPAQPSQPGGPAAMPHRFDPWWIAMLGGAGFLLLLLLRSMMRHRQTPALDGIMDVIDQETGEIRTVLLRSYPHGAAVRRQPLTILSWSEHQEQQHVLATITPSARGPLLTMLQDDTDSPARHLRAGERIQLDQQVELRYRI